LKGCGIQQIIVRVRHDLVDAEGHARTIEHDDRERPRLRNGGEH
jgi:hypothetical protein